MEPRELSLTAHEQADQAAALASSLPTAALPYEGFEDIWALFPGARPGTRTNGLQAMSAPIPGAAGFDTEEAYMARVEDLVRREQALANLREHYTRAALTPVPDHARLTAAPGPTFLPAKPAAQRRVVPAFVWKYSAIALSTGGATALAGIGVGAAAPGLAEIPDILAAAGQLVMGTAFLAALIILIGLFLTGGSGSRRTKSGTTVNIRKAVFRRNKFRG
ncbi:hypothetical protein [Streptomyces venezuelae]|uniref:hypothetical protein n=1 Tax=Streptomyces venezuelae TaxID=54571 RepID=UPI00343BA7ED